MGCIEVIWALVGVELLEKDLYELSGGGVASEGKPKEKVKASVVSEGIEETNWLIMNKGASKIEEWETNNKAEKEEREKPWRKGNSCSLKMTLLEI